MAMSAVEAIMFSARSASQEDVDKLCHKITELLKFPDKTAECCALLRQLFVLLQASYVEPCIPKALLQEMVRTVNRREGERSVSRVCQLCEVVVMEVMGGEQQVAEDVLPTPDLLTNKGLLAGYLLQGSSQQCLQSLLPAAVRWLCTKDLESQRHTLSFLVGMSCLHDVLKQEHVGEASQQLCTWLMTASVFQAPNPSSINPFRKDGDSQVAESDGTPCRNFFTVLNVGQYYTDDQYLNIHSFSLLYKWLHHCSFPQLSSPSQPGEEDGDSGRSPAVAIQRRDRLKPLGGEPSPRPSPLSGRGTPLGESPALSMGSRGSPRTRSPLTGSPASQWSGEGEGEVGVEGSSPRGKGVGRRRRVVCAELQSLVSRSVDYCFRLMDQCERKAKVTSDAELQIACLREVVDVLDLVCKLDRGQIARVHQEMRRLYTRLAQDVSHCSTVLRVVHFFLNHSAAVVHDPQEVYAHFFGSLLTQQFQDPGLAFDVVVFLCSNLTTLSHSTDVLVHFFPNILKVLAWHPHTFLTEFLDLLPAMMAPTTALEVFHTLLDLPCMTAALEVAERARRVDPPSMNQGGGVDPVNCVEAFHTPRFKPLFNFICRTHAGQGDTINKLSSLHKVLDEVKNKARVTYCSQVVPLMIRRWFQVIREEAEESFVMQVVPAILERSGLLLDLPDFTADVIMILGEEVLTLVERYPMILVHQASNIMEFLHITGNMQGRHNLYGNLIYCIGEYTWSQRCSGCTPELIGQYFEVLEVVTYEFCGTLTLEDHHGNQLPKVLCHLMAAMAKLASRRQDLIPRTMLCLTKVAKLHFTLTSDPLAQEALLSCAQEHLSLLQAPNFAVTVLNPPADIYTGKWHRDSFSLPRLIRGIHTTLSFSS